MDRGTAKPRVGFCSSLLGGLIILIWSLLGQAGVTIGLGLSTITLLGESGVHEVFGIMILAFAFVMMYAKRSRWVGAVLVVFFAILNVLETDLYFIGSVVAIVDFIGSVVAAIGGIIGYVEVSRKGKTY